jgi:hypothetical protein
MSTIQSRRSLPVAERVAHWPPGSGGARRRAADLLGGGAEEQLRQAHAELAEREDETEHAEADPRRRVERRDEQAEGRAQSGHQPQKRRRRQRHAPGERVHHGARLRCVTMRRRVTSTRPSASASNDDSSDRESPRSRSVASSSPGCRPARNARRNAVASAWPSAVSAAGYGASSLLAAAAEVAGLLDMICFE